ncbi:c-type cytochrome [Adhaeribacter rhizoryzae]|uniref:Cytochrome C n=1 Tax=Adhaeribacter rhizoryzae TaxID=2607907 RepID=A0A5M6DH61_9BACT|nr:c-type cytochrome [Adhaeribacter rhizoryzae]KAA5546763.1 cytochrome C [Adhaeribacter rhizoryzae]
MFSPNLLQQLQNIFICAFLGSYLLLGCNQPAKQNTQIKKDYIRAIPGENDTIPVAVAEKGEVLIAYSDCYTCHKEDKKSIGPAFKDIAKRYPVQTPYLDMLAQKIISGGSGSWGRAVMSPHPKVPLTDAKIMASYILSLKENK